MKYRILGFGALASVSAATAFYLWAPNAEVYQFPIPDLVKIEAGPYNYRPAGDFRIDTRIVDAPEEQRIANHSFEIMKYHVSQADYAACVADKACYASNHGISTTLAQVDVSYIDAKAYAGWFSDKTNQVWRLPTDEEWVRAAGDRFKEVILGDISNSSDPSKLWIRKYFEEAEKRGASDPKLRPIGAYGENNFGVADINGNIWEWTDTCFINGKVSEDGENLLEAKDYCGVRAAQGKHRAFIVDFVRDAKSGGCAVGIPPDNLGFRLVRDTY
jgi:formylglycine-generating enzyme required for sulfatase activity